MSMYPTTKFIWDDQSYIPSLNIEDTTDKPINMQVFTSDKGTEEYTYIFGKSFFDQYGKISFAKHGQPLLQAANFINSGGMLLAKRIVAPDAQMANVAVIAHLNTESVQKTDAEGNLLYNHAELGETTMPEGADTSLYEAIMIEKSTIKFSLVTIVSNSNDLGVICNQLEEMRASGSDEIPTDGYLLFMITDVGRGASNKRIRITPDYSLSRTSLTTKYILSVIENNEELESIIFGMNPDLIESDGENGGQNTCIERCVTASSVQIRCKEFDENIKAFFTAISEATGLPYEEVQYMDVLFGKTKRGLAVDGLGVSTEQDSISLDTIFGIPLSSGSNGSFGDSPITLTGDAKKLYIDAMIKCFSGMTGNETEEELRNDNIDYDFVYNVDNNPIDMIIDANYPEYVDEDGNTISVKRAAEELVSFREDCVFFRDMGLTPKSIAEFKIINQLNLKNRFCATYCNFFDIIDPYTKKQITVTIGYSLARVLVGHFVNGRNRPLAGQKYDIVFPEVVEGTLNFAPKVTPRMNQKEEMDDLRINYAGYYSNVLVLETEYTSQEDYTQLSYINNVLIVQQVIKAVRIACPKIRYSFIEGSDLERYKEDVQAILDKYAQFFKSISMEYVEDTTYAKNKIYYAVIRVTFKDFVQSEIFKLTALS